MQAIAHRSAYTHDASMIFGRNSIWLLVALVFGAVALPFLVYYTGLATRTLLLGPAAGVLLWRVLVAYAWPKGA